MEAGGKRPLLTDKGDPDIRICLALQETLSLCITPKQINTRIKNAFHFLHLPSKNSLNVHNYRNVFSSEMSTCSSLRKHWYTNASQIFPDPYFCVLSEKENLEKWYWWTDSQGRKRTVNIEHGLVDTGGEGEDGTNERVTLKYIHDHVWNSQPVGKPL